MAKAKQKARPEENRAAALDKLRRAGIDVDEAHTTLDRAVAEDAERISELETALESEQAARKSEVQSLKESHGKVVADLQSELSDANDKLRKVVGILS